MGENERGKAHEAQFIPAFGKSLKAALQGCTNDTKLPYTVNLVVELAASGTIRHSLPSPVQSVAKRVAKKIQRPRLPTPPEDGWLVGVHIAIHDRMKPERLTNR